MVVGPLLPRRVLFRCRTELPPRVRTTDRGLLVPYRRSGPESSPAYGAWAPVVLRCRLGRIGETNRRAPAAAVRLRFLRAASEPALMRRLHAQAHAKWRRAQASIHERGVLAICKTE